MKHLVFLLLIFVSISVTAQNDWKNKLEENLKTAMSKGRQFGKPYACDIKPKVNKEFFEAYKAQSDYLLEGYSNFEEYKAKSDNVKNKISFMLFMPKNEYGQFLYEYIVSAGWFDKNDIPFSSLTKHGKAYVLNAHLYPERHLIRDVIWSGEIKDGKIQGKGVGLAEYKDNKDRETWIIFEGEFDKGFPINKYKCYAHLGTDDIRPLFTPKWSRGSILDETKNNFHPLYINNDFALYGYIEDNNPMFDILADPKTITDIYPSTQRAEDEYVKLYYEDAIKFLQEKANQGDLDALYNLSAVYVYGSGVTKDMAKGMELLQQAADKGHVNSMYVLGYMYADGNNSFHNKTKAVKYFQQAADKGHVNGMVMYGRCFEDGMGVQQNYSKAEEWYKKALDKDPNNSFAKKHLADIPQKLQKIAEEKAKPDKDAKLIQEMFQEAKSYNKSGDASKFELREKFLNEFISTCSENPMYDKYKLLAKAKKLSSFCRVVDALYHWSDAPTNWYYKEKMLGLVKYPVWNERPTQMVIEAIDGALAICQKMTKDPDFGAFFTKSIPLLKEKRIKVNNNLSKERREYNAVVAENDARRESRNHEVDTDRHKSPSGELEFHTLLPADGYHYENDGELRSKSGSDYCTYNVHFDRNKKIDYYYIKSCSSKVRDYLKGKTKFKTGSELTSAFMNAIR
jgi:TPR repeat protein